MRVKVTAMMMMVHTIAQALMRSLVLSYDRIIIIIAVLVGVLVTRIRLHNVITYQRQVKVRIRVGPSPTRDAGNQGCKG